MKNRKTRSAMRRMLFTLALVLVVAVASVGGTIAWLKASTEPVINTFTVGDINITLAETGTTNNAKNYTFVPGDTLAKDPKVTVTAGSEDCYLFVKVEEANNTATGLTGKVINWSVDAGTDPASTWVPVPEHQGYWYRTVPAVAANTTEENLPSFDVLKDNQVTVNEEVTKDMVTGLTANKPTITVTAAAVQKDNVNTVADAWVKLPTAFTTP